MVGGFDASSDSIVGEGVGSAEGSAVGRGLGAGGAVYPQGCVSWSASQRPDQDVHQQMPSETQPAFSQPS